MLWPASTARSTPDDSQTHSLMLLYLAGFINAAIYVKLFMMQTVLTCQQHFVYTSTYKVLHKVGLLF